MSRLPPIHLTVVLHIEEPGPHHPDFVADRNTYLRYRSNLKALAEIIARHGAAFNFQSDWNFLEAVYRYDKGSVVSNTNGKNIVKWMHEDLGVEIDPHAHETRYNYADVAYLIERLGVKPSKNVGGFIYYPPNNPQGWEKHIKGIYGRVYPHYFWRADHLWGAATQGHMGPDDFSSGVWRPKDRFHFYDHDPNQRLIYIGCGYRSPFGVFLLLRDIKTGKAPAHGFYTASAFLGENTLADIRRVKRFDSFLSSLSPYVTRGLIIWCTLTEMARRWLKNYGGKPFRYQCRVTRHRLRPPLPPPRKI